MVHELAHGVVLPLCPPQCSGDTGLDLPFPVPREPWSHLIACQSHRCLSPGLGNQSFQEWGSAKFGKLCDLYRPLQPWPSQSLWGHKEQKRSPGGCQTQVLKPVVFLSRPPCHHGAIYRREGSGAQLATLKVKTHHPSLPNFGGPDALPCLSDFKNKTGYPVNLEF